MVSSLLHKRIGTKSVRNDRAAYAKPDKHDEQIERHENSQYHQPPRSGRETDAPAKHINDD